MTIEKADLTHDEFIYTCHTMKNFGGGFCTSIAEAGFNADSDNKKRLIAAFPELFEKYGPGSDFYKAYLGYP